ncbi:MAG: arylesterase [Rhodocyclales bacterium]|jgi:acyl-CoA thioesterase-1|nr:arylesterase [Sulfuritalea sp.]MCE9570516.1 arylesterase [Rhodocyclales bacterium]
MFKRFLSHCCLLVLLLSGLHATAAEQRILVYGDSLSAGFGIAVSQSWPALLGQRLSALGSGATVANASISGETTAGGRARFITAMAHFRPTIVILALGANDGLRGLPVSSMKDNLAFMLVHARQQGARVLLVGMRLPPNYGQKYTQEFDAAFRDLAKREKVRLLPFLLEPIALDQNAYQADGLHPTAAVQSKILDHVWNALKPLLA